MFQSIAKTLVDIQESYEQAYIKEYNKHIVTLRSNSKRSKLHNQFRTEILSVYNFLNEISTLQLKGLVTFMFSMNFFNACERAPLNQLNHLSNQLKSNYSEQMILLVRELIQGYDERYISFTNSFEMYREFSISNISFAIFLAVKNAKLSAEQVSLVQKALMMSADNKSTLLAGCEMNDLISLDAEKLINTHHTLTARQNAISEDSNWFENIFSMRMYFQQPACVLGANMNLEHIITSQVNSYAVNAKKTELVRDDEDPVDYWNQLTDSVSEDTFANQSVVESSESYLVTPISHISSVAHDDNVNFHGMNII